MAVGVAGAQHMTNPGHALRDRVAHFSLADPEVYEWSNLNRQECLLRDIGRYKAVVLAERIQEINTLIQASAVVDGVTLENRC